MVSIKRSYLAIVILALLSEEERHGYKLRQIIEGRINGLQIPAGTLYPLLQDLQQRELVEGEWRTHTNGRGRKYFRITPKGMAFLEQECMAVRDFFIFMKPFLDKAEHATEVS